MTALDFNVAHASPQRLIRFGPLRYAPIAAVSFAVHMLGLLMLRGLPLATAQAIAALASSISTYGINEILSYPRRGSWRWYLGLLPFLASCALGVAGSVLLAGWLAQRDVGWFAAGAGGALVGIWWNYGAADRHSWATR